MENNRRSLFGVLQEIGKAADGRKKKGRQHSLGNILTLVTLGYLMGIEHIRRMMFFFDKGTLFEAPVNEDGHVEHRTDRAKAKACIFHSVRKQVFQPDIQSLELQLMKPSEEA